MEALTAVRGRAHVLDIIYDIFDGLCLKKEYEAADRLLRDFATQEPWLILGALTATNEFKANLPNRHILYMIAYEKFANRHGVPYAETTMNGLE